jgi:tetratricopeptide (TPR) repeat protein
MFETFDRLYQEYVRRAQSPQDDLSRVAIETLEGYFRSHPLPSERIEQINKLITDNNWGSLNHERNLEVVYIFWTARAQRAYDDGHYDAAVRLVQHSLEMAPGQWWMALRVLGEAQFARANFSQAAAEFRKLLDLSPTDPKFIVRYCDALVARHTPAESLQEYTAWLDEHPQSTGRSEVGVQTRLELGRLTMAAKGVAAANLVLFPTVAAGAESLPAEMRGQYGWWFYESGEYDSAQKWLQSAVEEDPADIVLQTRLGWALIQQHNLEGAIQRFSNNGYDPATASRSPNTRRRIFIERLMGLAVAEWQAKQPDRALGEFTGVLDRRPEWLNPKWVGAIYSPEVAKTIEELKMEQAKRHGRQAVR